MNAALEVIGEGVGKFCLYLFAAVFLIGGAFFGVQVLLPPQNDATAPKYLQSLEKIEAGAARELPPMWEGKPEALPYVSRNVEKRTRFIPQEARVLAPFMLPPTRPEISEAVQIPPFSPPPAAFIPPDNHRVY